MRLNRVLRIVCALIALATTASFAQQYTVKKLFFDGKMPYPQAALEAASGIKPGDIITQDTMQQAAQRLSDTGAFADISMSLDGPIKGITVIFKVKAASPDNMLQASFNNLIWFTPAEIDAGLHSRIPLYGPTLPESGNTQDAVQNALADMLQQKGVTATIKHEVIEPSAARPARYVDFFVSHPTIRIREVHLSGVSTDLAPAVRQRLTKLMGAPLNLGISRVNSDDLLLEPYLTGGYISAQLTGRTVTQVTPTPERIDIDLSGTINPGPLYHLGEVTWAGSPQMSSAAFATASPLHTGDLASTEILAKAVATLAYAYRCQGYADVIVDPHPALDASTGRVSYAFTVAPGEVYHIHSITPLNLPAAQQREFDANWKLKAGDIFNPDYIVRFLIDNTKLTSFDGYSASFKATRDPDTRLVDVEVTFVHGGVITVR
jgi:outer membrane protein assembly factor BamA